MSTTLYSVNSQAKYVVSVVTNVVRNHRTLVDTHSTLSYSVLGTLYYKE